MSENTDRQLAAQLDEIAANLDARFGQILAQLAQLTQPDSHTELHARVAAVLEPTAFPERHRKHVARWLADDVMTVVGPELNTRDDRIRELEAQQQTILRTVADWCIESWNVGGIDAGDLDWRLKQAGHPLPIDDTDPTTEEATQ